MKKENTVPKRLPTIIHKGKEYVIDWRLQEFRTVNPPLQFISFDSELGREIDSSMVSIEPFALFGTYEYGNRNNVEVIASSEDYEELVKIRDAIKAVNEKLQDKDRDWNNADDDVRRLVDDSLSSIDMVDEITDFIHEIDILGIFRLEECNFLTIKCPKCRKILFEGTRKQAKRLAVYCDECAL
ncbi:hypothetical protein ACFL0Q_03160 [Thermodesulfobacteriota bacterium]